MSRIDDWGSDRQAGCADKSVEQEAAFRLGLSREAAKGEMEQFRGAEHYTVRTIVGRKSRRLIADVNGQYVLGFLGEERS
jgi:hypothetical protein